MNVIEIVLFLGFVETVILFFYAIRWYVFSIVSLKSRKIGDPEKPNGSQQSCFASVLLPVYNEPNVIDRLLKACTSFNSPPYEVIVINDSDDGITTKKLEAWRTHAKVKLIHRDRREGWKGGALNVGLEKADPRSTHILVFDADFVPPTNLVSRFLSKFDDNRIAAVQGYQKHDLNADENWIAKAVRVWMSLYYMIELRGQQRLGLFSMVTGSVFMVQADVLRKLQFEEVITEDWELTLRLYENGYKILYDPTLAASGECPNTLRRICRQQARWAEGHTRTFRNHFLKILRSKFLRLREKIDFLVIGSIFLNSILIVALTIAGLITMLFPSVYLPLPIVQAGMLLFLASVPAAILGSMAALSLEGTKRDFRKIGYAWLLNYLVTPVVAFATLKGLFTKKGYFHRTYKTGRIIERET